ncbi:VOC family protein [Bradyrhizobium sp.]|uniref:VOC family protein n=1 Tax=Bradyrhizobium sp. TaxID=376 RepID=UPI002618182D|nr:VOC family protein [Bradyrhizobium sp.]
MSIAAVIAFRLTTADPDRLARFYCELGFTAEQHQGIPDEEIAVLGLDGTGARLSLRLGAQRVDLDSFETRGKPYPSGVTSADLCFQHLALVSDDAHAAWARATTAGAAPISTRGPVTLPASAGGVTAVKFRDPEGHPLELLQFPPGNRWRGTGILGIDHSAISVSDIGASCRFYEKLGLSVQHPTLNSGSTQVALDGLPDVEVGVVPMMPRADGPHLELLAYQTPTGRPSGQLRANDVAATRIVWAADRRALVRDPDGHLHLLERLTAA